MNKKLRKRPMLPLPVIFFSVLLFFANPSCDAMVVIKSFSDLFISDLKEDARKGDLASQYKLGFLYSGFCYSCEYPKKDTQEALDWFRMGAKAGYAPSQRGLGAMYMLARDIPHDYKEAAVWLAHAANQGDAIAQDMLGKLYRDGHGVPQNTPEAIRWFRKAAEGGETDGCRDLERLYFLGAPGLPKDLNEAYFWHIACWQREVVLLELPNPFTDEESRDTREVAIARSQELKKLPEEVKNRALERAKEFSARMQKSLDAFAAQGRQAAEQEATRIKSHLPDWKRKANTGNLSAQRRLGDFYSDGAYTPIDLDEAEKWYRMAADQGSTVAMAQIANLYSGDAGMKQNPAEVFAWQSKAAQRGDPFSQSSLSSLYREGKGVAQDKTEAYFWCRLAERKIPGRSMRVAFGCRPDDLTEEQKTATEKRVQEWRLPAGYTDEKRD